MLCNFLLVIVDLNIIVFAVGTREKTQKNTPQNGFSVCFMFLFHLIYLTNYEQNCLLCGSGVQKRVICKYAPANLK